ncbi:peptidoglycan DD-metalloendopeptidase family protein [Mesonia sp. K4-1]|uniref:peptidoglycan DD-metalloendopeptidase family protein n=1 Tax=Mesonia sp. K4-1 TaxID=2602760 RepID=UPI0011C6ED4A|nr:peptidoglycan DD-metalloendopeptidase family protein [Mesonia sp. K4-1]TXK77618.1 peptidoglycan DD-metalloendopeptidase family protein [Mesonia sp. K4-1]
MNFNAYLNSLTPDFTPIVDHNTLADYIAVDLSIHQSALKEVDTSSSKVFQDYLTQYLISSDKKVAYGGYLEERNLYARSTYFTSDKENSRNIHLGIDIWCPANTPVLLPLNGKIHSFKNNQNHGDYGPTIIIEHSLEAHTFYTLYGHLTLSSLDGIQTGDVLEKGSVIGYLGEASVNGDYAPHLHFQIIRDLEGNRGDYPGVCAVKDLAFYTENCPNPNLLLKLP